MASIGPGNGAAGPREQRRARIEHVALELFRQRGFDQVTVEDVCAEAGVAPATFYRYFGTKEEVVFAYEDGFAAALRRAVQVGARVEQPARLAVVLEEFARFLESQQDLLAVRDQIVQGQPRLMQRTLMVQRELEAVLAAGLADLPGPYAEDAAAAQMEAGAGFVVLRVAVRSWRAAGGGSLREAVRTALALLHQLVGGAAAGDQGPDPAPGTRPGTSRARSGTADATLGAPPRPDRDPDTGGSA